VPEYQPQVFARMGNGGIAQRLEHSAYNRAVMGSNPIASTIIQVGGFHTSPPSHAQPAVANTGSLGVTYLEHDQTDGG
jgi:hypothetical protein